MKLTFFNLYIYNYFLELENKKICTKIKIYPCPKRAERSEILERKRRFALDSQLMLFLQSWMFIASYMALLAIICSHNNITDSYWQNQQITTAINSSFKVWFQFLLLKQKKGRLKSIFIFFHWWLNIIENVNWYLSEFLFVMNLLTGQYDGRYIPLVR